jgi:L-xylulokinase
MHYYLGLDNGGTLTKAALYTPQGKEIALVSRKTEVFSKKPGFAERDMDQMRLANYEVIQEILQTSKVEPDQICGIAICGHGKGLYLVDESGAAVRPGILSSDNRAWRYPLKWKESGIDLEVYEKTFQQILPSQPVSLLAWLFENERESIDKTRWVFQCKDYVRFCLTGEAYGEMTDYSGANLINLVTRSYDRDLLSCFGIGEIYGKLPPLKSTTDVCGYITADVAKRTGLKEGTPVMGGMFDIDACAVAVNGASTDNVCMIAGTWSINEYVSKEPVKDHSVMMNSIFCDPAFYLVEESSPTSAVNLEWFVKTMLPEVSQLAKQEGSSVYKYADSCVDSVPEQDACPIYFPFIMASNVHPNAKACFLGMSYYHTRAHLIKSIYEGVAFSHRYHLERLMKGRKASFECVRLAGGVANSPQWLQIFADVLNQRLEVVEVKETGTLGCAMNVAVSVGDYPDFSAAAKAMVRVAKKVEPDSTKKDLYDKRYAVYKRLLETLDPVWPSVQELFDGDFVAEAAKK